MSKYQKIPKWRPDIRVFGLRAKENTKKYEQEKPKWTF